MSDIICVTNRKLCRGDFLQRLEEIAAAKPAGVILREKDLPKPEYSKLARDVLKLCRQEKVPCILHSFVDVAMELNSAALHLPLPILRTMSREEKAGFAVLGASCHSVEEAAEAQRLGCTYITAGHIFDTDCKRGVPGRGVAFLAEVCQRVSIPVYAIGGVNSENISALRTAGASGACVMSGLMQCDDVRGYFEEFEKAGN